jgi:phosphopantothenoylcysteine decarboxylase / phosphopantothenate---cysteine ligase
MANERVLITAGATREMIDPVRFISNRSSGKMGFALAEAARDRGATVRVVSGITTVAPPSGVHITRVSTADEMLAAVLHEFPEATIFIGAAAVADYRAKHSSETKIKKEASHFMLELERTPDILNTVGQERTSGQFVVGFAAETNDLISHAEKKLNAKNLDMIVANDVTREDAAFDSDSNEVTILIREGQKIELPLSSKLAVANRIFDEIIKLRRKTNEQRKS